MRLTIIQPLLKQCTQEVEFTYINGFNLCPHWLLGVILLENMNCQMFFYPFYGGNLALEQGLSLRLSSSFMDCRMSRFRMLCCYLLPNKPG